VQDVGSSLDVYLQSIIHGLSDAVLLEAYGWYSSKDGRYWLYLNGDFYVFSYFPGTRISAWTKYGTSVVDESSLSAYTPKCFTTSNGYLYMLGQAADGYVALVSYPSSASYRTTAYLTLPFYDMKSPGSLKHFKAIDIAGTGTWKVEVGNNPNDITSFTTLVAALPSRPTCITGCRWASMHPTLCCGSRTRQTARLPSPASSGTGKWRPTVDGLYGPARRIDETPYGGAVH